MSALLDKAQKAWRVAAVEFQREEPLNALRQLARRHGDLYSLINDIKENSRGLAL